MIDTNIILDFLLQREPHIEFTNVLFNAVELNRYEGFVSVLSIANVVYIMHKLGVDMETIKSSIRKLLIEFQPISVSEYDVYETLDSEFKDFEDSIHIHQAERLKLDYIVTRDQKHFTNSTVPIISPEEFVSKMFKLDA